MIDSKEKKIIRIFWEDAVIYKKPLNKSAFSLKKRITEGEVLKEGEEFVIVKNPITFDYSIKLKKYVPFVLKRKITFFFIPTGMINKKELIG